MWGRTWPDAINTGILTRTTPTLDADILNEDAAVAIEELVREHYEEAGYVLMRIGRPPKRAFLFRTDEPFAKIVINFVARNGGEPEKLEFLGDGQQVVVAGIHPDTHKPYSWFGGEPGPIAREDLPYIREAEAREADRARRRAAGRRFRLCPRRRAAAAAKRTSDDAAANRGAADWQYLCDRIRAGEALHDSLRDLAAKLIASGMEAGAAVNFLRAQMESSSAPHDERWRERFNEIPRLVDSAEKRFAKPERGSRSPRRRWYDRNRRDAQGVRQVAGAAGQDADLRRARHRRRQPAARRSGLARPDRAAVIRQDRNSQRDGAASEGGAGRDVDGRRTAVGHAEKTARQRRARRPAAADRRLRHHRAERLRLDPVDAPETKAEVLAALREIYDGAWTRHVGSEGGRTLAWKGKVGLLFAATGVIDSHYSVIGSMGDRFLLSRLAPVGRGQFARAMRHVGAGTGQMRKELAEAVAQLFAGRRAEAQAIKPRRDRAHRQRDHAGGAAARRRRPRPAEQGNRGRLRRGRHRPDRAHARTVLAGLDTLGVERATAMEVVETVALDSVPPYRRAPTSFSATCTTPARAPPAPRPLPRRWRCRPTRCGAFWKNSSPTDWSIAGRRDRARPTSGRWIDWEAALPPLEEGETQ